VHPETKIKSPLTTAREYPIWDSKGEPEEIRVREAIFGSMSPKNTGE